MTFTVESPIRNILACLCLLFSFGPNVFAQNPEILSRRPPVIRTFDPNKDEFTVTSFLFDPNALPSMGGFGPNSLPPPSIRLHSVEYKYQGTLQPRPQAVAFTLRPLDKYKSAPSFSFTVDGTALLEGETTVNDLCCATVNGHTQNGQQIVITVPTETFQTMAQAKKIELKVGKHSIKLNDFQRKCLTALASTIK